MAIINVTTTAATIAATTALRMMDNDSKRDSYVARPVEEQPMDDDSSNSPESVSYPVEQPMEDGKPERTTGEKLSIAIEIIAIALYLVYLLHCWGLSKIPVIDKVLGRTTAEKQNENLNEWVGWWTQIKPETPSDERLNDWAAWHMSHSSENYDNVLYEADGDE